MKTIILILSLFFINCLTIFGEDLPWADLPDSFAQVGYKIVRNSWSGNSRTIILQAIKDPDKTPIIFQYEFFSTSDISLKEFESMNKMRLIIKEPPFKIGDQIIWNYSPEDTVSNVAIRFGKFIITANSKGITPIQLKTLLLDLVEFTKTPLALQKLPN